MHVFDCLSLLGVLKVNTKIWASWFAAPLWVFWLRRIEENLCTAPLTTHLAASLLYLMWCSIPTPKCSFRSHTIPCFRRKVLDLGTAQSLLYSQSYKWVCEGSGLSFWSSKEIETNPGSFQVLGPHGTVHQVTTRGRTDLGFKNTAPEVLTFWGQVLSVGWLEEQPCTCTLWGAGWVWWGGTLWNGGCVGVELLGRGWLQKHEWREKSGFVHKSIDIYWMNAYSRHRQYRSEYSGSGRLFKNHIHWVGDLMPF